MKKQFTILFLGLLIICTSHPKTGFATVIHGWTKLISLAPVVTFVVMDESRKYIEKKIKKKNSTSYSYSPAPGYTTADRYWNFLDIQNHFEEYHNDYHFKNENPPENAIAFLPENIYTDRPETHVAKRSEEPPIYFPLETLKDTLKKGDIIFSRGENLTSRGLQHVTSWVHVGIVLDPLKGSMFESHPEKGVSVYFIPEKWGRAYSYSVKRIKPEILTQYDIDSAIKDSLSRYKGKPYWPPFYSSHQDRGKNFLPNFSNKHSEDSFYCSKLVWKTYSLAGIDLDTNRTTSHVMNNYEYEIIENGAENKYAWIGVSGDDIYFSQYLTKDLYLYGASNLVEPRVKAFKIDPRDS